MYSKGAWVILALVSALGVAGCGVAVHSGSSGSTSVSGETFEVTKYGATGNGTSDDSGAITAAFNAAWSAGGGTVHFPCGEYNVETISTLAPGGRSVLYLPDGKNITLAGEGSCSHVFTTLQQKSLIELGGGTNISVSNLHLTAVNAVYIEQYGFGGGSALRMSGVQGGSVTQLIVDGATAGAIYLTAGTSNVSVSNNTVQNTYGAGIWEDDCGGTNDQNCLPSMPPSGNTYEFNNLVNTTLAQLSAIDLDDGNGVSKAIVKNNTISWTQLPLANNPEVHCIQLNNASGVTVSSNSCTGTPWDAIVITTGPKGQSNNDIVENNTMTNSGISSIGGSGIVIYDDPQGNGIAGFTVINNTITTAGDDGIRIYAASTPSNIHDGSMSQNTIYNSDQHDKGTRFGIDLNGSTSIAIADNSISGDGTCIAVGINAVQSGETVAALKPNTIFSILGPPIEVH